MIFSIEKNTKHQWHKWFSWYMVPLNDGKEIALFEWVWRKKYRNGANPDFVPLSHLTSNDHPLEFDKNIICDYDKLPLSLCIVNFFSKVIISHVVLFVLISYMMCPDFQLPIPNFGILKINTTLMYILISILMLGISYKLKLFSILYIRSLIWLKNKLY